MASLEIQLKSGETLVHKLEGDVTIGRAPQNTVLLNCPSVSAQHATIRENQSDFILSDTDSRNGMRVNGSKIQHVILRDGDRIQFGDVHAVFHIESLTKERLPETRPILRQETGAQLMPPPVPQRAHTTHAVTPAAKTNHLAVWCLVLGIASVLVPSIPILPAFAAMFCGNSALKAIKASNGAEKGRGLAITGLFFSFAYVAIVLLYMLALFFGPGGSPMSAAKTNSGRIEELILESWQKDTSQAGIQGLFDSIHPTGKATNIKFHDVSIQQWKRGIDTNRYEDIVKYNLRLTLYWEGPVTKDGFTKLNFVYDAEAGRPIDMQILGTNGITKADAAKAAGNVLEMMLQLDAIKRGQENATRQYLNDAYRRSY